MKYKVSIFGDNGDIIEWGVFDTEQQARRQRHMLIVDDDYHPDEVFIEQVR